MGLIANVYRQVNRQMADGTAVMMDCTNNGWSSRFNQVVIVNADGPFDPDPSMPAVRLVLHPAKSVMHVFAVLDEHYREGKWTMMGGNFLYTSDSRFGECARKLLEQRYAERVIRVHRDDLFVGAVPIHDRIE
jgi:hypothetical protein